MFLESFSALNIKLPNYVYSCIVLKKFCVLRADGGVCKGSNHIISIVYAYNFLQALYKSLITPNTGMRNSKDCLSQFNDNSSNNVITLGFVHEYNLKTQFCVRKKKQFHEPTGSL